MLSLELDRRAMIGVVHLRPTPGSPRFQGSMGGLLEAAAQDARALAEGGCDGIIVENFGDAPFFPGSVPPETVAALALALAEVRGAAASVPVGINVLRNDARSALGLCATAGAEFLRVNVHTGAAVTDQGVIEGRAAETLRERGRLCPEALLLADVHVKHAEPLGGGSIAQAARDVRLRGLADALILSGTETGAAPDRTPIDEVRRAVGEATPILLGSGVNVDNAPELLRGIQGAIVGTATKRSGEVRAPVELARVAALRRAFDAVS